MIRRDWLLIAALGVLILVIGFWYHVPATVQLLVTAFAYGLIALGLNIQWGYGGLFNFGVMGFLMLGGYATVAMAFPVNMDFWNSDGPMMLSRAIAVALAGFLLITGALNLHRIGIKGPLKAFLVTIAWAISYIAYRSQIDPAAQYIEAEAGFVGGLGLPVLFGWLFGGLLAGAVAFLIGRICLGLRTDYLAIATIGISEIIRAMMKNMDWLTHGTLTVSPIPWPVPQQPDFMAWGADASLALTLARSSYLVLTLAAVIICFLLLQRAYHGPWGRMMRAIRDNDTAAEAMGKDVRKRQLEIFVLGSVLMGMGGAILTGYVQIYDPGGYQPINHTFILWAMVIVGGAGNNLGAIFGAVLLILIWSISDPLAQILFSGLSNTLVAIGLPAIPEIDSRALQMRVFILGLAIVLSLRYAPKGLIPERIGGSARP